MKTRFFPVGASCLIALIALTQSAMALPADLDLTFGGTGNVLTPISSGGESYSVALQDDGKIVLAGYSFNGTNNDVAVVRYNSNGGLDTTFGGTGKVITSIGPSNAIGTGVVMQSDGKIVVSVIRHNGIDNDFVILRYNPDGSLDTSFNGSGKVVTDIGNDIGFSVTVQSDDKILIAGGSSSDIAVLRYNTNGTLDTTFNGTGFVITAIGSGVDTGWKVAVQGDGKIVVGGEFFNGSKNDFAVVRYNTNGSLDTSFGSGGKVTTSLGSGDDVAYGLGLQSDGKIVLSGSSGNGNSRDFALARYNTNGSLDTTFGSTGKVITDIGGGDDWGLRMALQGDGKIVMTGFSFNGIKNDFAVVRYNTNGTLDTSFNGTGKKTLSLSSSDSIGHSLAIQGDGKIVIAAGTLIGGSSVFAVVRFQGDLDTDRDGIFDWYETSTGIYVSPTDTGTSPTNPDTDGDGISDGEEVFRYQTNPNLKDTDGDGFDDPFEISTGFDPKSATSTPDALSSIRLAVEYRFNAALGISYRVEASTDLTNWSTIEPTIMGNGGVITRFYSIEGQQKRFLRSRRN